MEAFAVESKDHVSVNPKAPSHAVVPRRFDLVYDMILTLAGSMSSLMSSSLAIFPTDLSITASRAVIDRIIIRIYRNNISYGHLFVQMTESADACEPKP